MERRAIFAVVISLLILLVYERVMQMYYPPPTAEQLAQPQQPEAPNVAPATAPALEPAVPAAAVPAIPERLVSVDAPLYVATFSTNGARLVSFRLKRYRTLVQADSPPQETLLPGPNGEAPIGVELRGTQGVEPLSDVAMAYNADHEKLTIDANASGELSFDTTASGLNIRKKFVFHPDNYEISSRVEVDNIPAGYNELLLSFSKAADAHTPGEEVVFDKTVFLNATKRIEHSYHDLEKGEVIEGDIRWTGYVGRHFFAGMALDEARNQRLWLKLRDKTVEQKLLIPLSSKSVQVPLEIFIGPKDVDALEQAAHNFDRAVDLGRFAVIAKPLLHVLELFHRITGNYGIDIILLTLIIKLLFIPLTRSSFKSMQAMQKLQPQMQKLREKLKDSPEQMNKEIMELYRRHKVNPFGGCLPMILQIPVFIGLYTALNNAVELHHAPFMLWINDLAAPDRLGSLHIPFVEPAGIPVLTLLMGASMFLQQWMTPSMGDPAQRQMMMVMPLMFTFMFVNFPSGLSLYWLVNNVLTIAQQYYMNRTQPKSGG